MDGASHKRSTVTLTYPRHLNPEDWLRFIELDIFTQDWRELGLTDEDLLALQIAIMAGPQLHPVISGTGGLRKIRFAPAAWRRGKRGAARVCFAYFPGFSIVLLVAAFDKNEKEDITQEERRTIKRLLREFERLLDHGIDKKGIENHDARSAP
jgi:hypothetical protein